MAAHRTATTTTDSNNNNRGPEENNSNNRLYRLRKASRLPDAAAFSRVFRGAKRSRDDFFTVLFKPNGMRCARLGLAISKKHCRKASGRNRLKRVVRESFRKIQSDLGGVDVVVLAHRGTGEVDNGVLFDSLARHWQRIRRAGKG